MWTGSTTVAGRGRSARRRWSALGGALAVAVLLSGNVAAFQLVRDDGGNQPLVTPKVSKKAAVGQQLRFKLATPAGYDALVRG
jgi:hypothetical protein